MSWFGSDVADSAKGIGSGISTATQGIRSMFTGEIPPDIAAKLMEIETEANKLMNERWISDNGAGGLASMVRPAVFLLLVLVYVALILVQGFTEVVVGDTVIESVQGLLRGRCFAC